jgi:hypothetical protein
MAELLLPSLETIRAPWRSAFDAAESALRAADASLAPAEVRERSRRLSGERAATVALLDAVARAEGVPAGSRSCSPQHSHASRGISLRKATAVPRLRWWPPASS